MIEFARWEMRGELSGLWQVCFHEPARFPNYFLNNCFAPENCLVYRVENTLAAAVYLLPARIAGKRGESFQAHYIFAAATLPHFRSRGYMASLLACAAMEGAKRGDSFSFLLPAEPSLVEYYGKIGYEPFFRVRTVAVSAERLQQEALGRTSMKTLPDARCLNALRSRELQQLPGSALWSDEMFHFSTNMSAAYGDRLICAFALKSAAYALCRVHGPQGHGPQCSVLELMAEPEAFPSLAAAILREVPAESYRFRLPVGFGPFPGEGEASAFGMIRPIGGATLSEVESEAPYLGLGLD